MTFSQFEGYLGLLFGPGVELLWPIYIHVVPGPGRGVVHRTPAVAPAGEQSTHFQLSATNLICVSELFLNGHLSLSPGSGCNIGALERLLQGSFKTLTLIFFFLNVSTYYGVLF